MSQQDPLGKDINKKTSLPQVNSGLSGSRGRGQVNTNWKNINWTKKKIILVSIALGFPYAVAVIASLVAEIYLITGILIAVAILVAVLFLTVRWIDRNDNF